MLKIQCQSANVEKECMQCLDFENARFIRLNTICIKYFDFSNIRSPFPPYPRCSVTLFVP